MADIIIQATNSTFAPHVNLAPHLKPQVDQKSVNGLTNLILQMPKKMIIADIRIIQNSDEISLLQMDKIKEKKSLSSRAIIILRITKLGETIVALGSCAVGIYSILQAI
jgi:hypothetical protein